MRGIAFASLLLIISGGAGGEPVHPEDAINDADRKYCGQGKRAVKDVNQCLSDIERSRQRFRERLEHCSTYARKHGAVGSIAYLGAHNHCEEFWTQCDAYGYKRHTTAYAQCLQTEATAYERRLADQERQQFMRDQETDRMIFDLLNRPAR